MQISLFILLGFVGFTAPFKNICLFERVISREGNTGNLPSAGSLPRSMASAGPDWNWSFFVSHMGVRGPKTRAISHCLSQTWSGNWIWGRAVRTGAGAHLGYWHHRGSFIHCATMPASAPCFLNFCLTSCYLWLVFCFFHWHVFST